MFARVSRAWRQIFSMWRQPPVVAWLIDLSTWFSKVISTTCPQNLSSPRSFFLAGIALVCDPHPTAKVLANRSGTQRPRRVTRNRNGLRIWNGLHRFHRHRSDRTGSSEPRRTGSIKMGLARVTVGLPTWCGGRGSSEPEQLACKALRGGTVQEGVRACPRGHDARTASEHLAPFPVEQPEIIGPVRTRCEPPGMKTGRVHLSATEPRPQRQLMHYRVLAPVRAGIHPGAGEINQIS